LPKKALSIFAPTISQKTTKDPSIKAKKNKNLTDKLFSENVFSTEVPDAFLVIFNI
jgi:hypothetical protein